jgi:RHS repeat-associated protein
MLKSRSVVASRTRHNAWPLAALILILPLTAPAQTITKPQGTLTTIYSFIPDIAENYPNGCTPFGGFILGDDGNFYGTTLGCSTLNQGTIYRISPSGAFQLLHSFTGGTDGGGPVGPLAKDSSGAIYGTTRANTAFRITPDGVFTSFGYLPGGMFNVSANGLAYASDGNLYGTSLTQNGGLLFSLTPDGVITTIHSFDFRAEGSPGFMLPGTDGRLYGLLYGGSQATSFVSVTLDGVVTPLADVRNTAGGLLATRVPGEGFVQGADGNFYFAVVQTVIQIAPSGAVTVPPPFLLLAQGSPLIQGIDGNLYGASNDTVYKITAGGQATNVFQFAGSESYGNPGGPPSALVQGPDGSLYGTTQNSGGTIFKLTLTPSGSSSGGGGTPASVNPESLGDPSGVPGSCNCGDPISVGAGNLFEQVADYRTSGPNPLGFTRSYNSLGASNTFATTLGTNWRSNYDRYLRIVSPSSVIAERPDGQQVSFTLSSGAWTTSTDVDLKLTNTGATWTLTDSRDTVETYNATSPTEALLQTIRTRNGYTQTLQYGSGNQLSTVTDSFNRRLSFAYSGGHLQTVTTPDALILTYAYTGAQLTSVGYSTSPPTTQTYLYENTALPSALTGIIDENGNRYTTWTYDSTGRALSSQHAGGAGLTKVSYNDTDGSRTITTPLGEQEVYKFTTLQGVPKVAEVDRLASGTTTAATRKYTYDSNGFTASQTDWNGNLTSYVNDAHGQPTTINEAVGTPQARSTTITYHATFHLPLKIVTPGLITSYTYDANGQVLTKILADTTTTSGQTRTWTYTWSNFLLASVQTPRTDVKGLTTFIYDGSGALTARTNALGQTTKVTQHLPGGLPQTTVDTNGVTTNLTYDPRQRLLSSTVATAAGPLTTSYSYDAAGNRLSVTLPDGSAIANTYDAAHRLTGVTDLFNASVSYTLDALGGRTQSNIADASATLQLKHSAKFDSLGRLLQDIGAAGQTTNIAYDSNSNALTVTDPLSHATQRAFDPLNRPIAITDPAGGVTTTSYDAHNRPTGVTDSNGGVTTYVYDGFGDVIQRVSPDSGTTVYRYDLDGNLAQRVDGAGAATNYTYDALDRVKTVSYPADAAENVAYTYDQGAFGIGRLTAVADAAGTLTRSYDERGNLLKETRIGGAAKLVTIYTYDPADRVASITYPSGWTAAYTRDAMGRTTAVTAQPPGPAISVPVLATAAYQPFGPINALTLGNGVAESRSFDLDYRLTGLADTGAAALQNLTYAYDAANNVSSIIDGVTAGNSQTFGYDALDRLTSAAGGYGSFGYTYDSVGNRLSQTSAGAAATYSYAAGSNQLTAITATGVPQAIGYDKAGNVTNFSPANALYNQAGQLATVMAGNNLIARYTYDAFGRRLARVGAVTATTLYQYDQSTHLLEETDGQGNPLADYIYLGALPIATISPSTAQVYFLHADRLSTPQSATDNNQNVVWTANYGPFGEMSAVPSLIVQNLRLPGQEFDIETGLYHNGFRDYAPGWGRYLQSDPIGLTGGLNTYAYARGNPARWIDPLGLCTVTASGDNAVIQIAPDDTVTVQGWASLTPAQQQQIIGDLETAYVQQPLPTYNPFRDAFVYLEELLGPPPPPPCVGLCSGGGIRG